LILSAAFISTVLTKKSEHIMDSISESVKVS
jgi:hypothetical protein